ncbi:MAG: IS4 family transposase [Myxococcota bacterium]
MPKKPPTELCHQSIAELLRSVLGEDVVDDIARETGFLKRKRSVTPLAMLCACVSTLATGTARWLADILRTFNDFTGASVRYKPFHKQLAKPEFAEFVRRLLSVVLGEMSMPVLRSLPGHKLSVFKDIVIHDGTSFALKDALVSFFPGRFTKVSPAAVALHVTMSALADNAIEITLAPDKEAERAFSHAPESLRGCLLLEDRGYEQRATFVELDEHGCSFIIRGNTSIKPTVLEARAGKRRLRNLETKVLNLKKLPRGDVDLEIEWGRGKNRWRGRLVVLYRGGPRGPKRFTLLHTNLNRCDFATAEVGQLYRLRWQIELLFKEWKSHASLRRFDTSKPTIAEAMIWLSLLGATLKRFLAHSAEQIQGVELSTQRVANAARHFLDDILRCLMTGGRNLAAVLVRAFRYMAENTRRAHPERDRKRGRLASGLRPRAIVKV